MPKFLSAAQAKKIDELLMGPQYRFSIDQLMEMAGISVAGATRHYLMNYASKSKPLKEMKVLSVCGPGNNGGDAQVASRHLRMYGVGHVDLWAVKSPQKDLYKNLIHQCREMEVGIYEGEQEDTFTQQKLKEYDLILDGIFGFSFKGDIREPYKSVIKRLKSSGTPVLSIDVPSGCSVDGDSNSNEDGFQSEALISLTAPKQCCQNFKGVHYLGGRFVPPRLQREFELELPEYEEDRSWTLLSSRM